MDTKVSKELVAVIFSEVLSSIKIHGVAFQGTVIENRAFVCVVTFPGRIWTAITLSLILQELLFNDDVTEMKVIGNYTVLVFRNASSFCPYHFCLYQL